MTKQEVVQQLSGAILYLKIKHDRKLPSNTPSSNSTTALKTNHIHHLL